MAVLAATSPVTGARPPVFDPKIGPEDRPQLQREVRDLLERDDQQLRALVPERNGLIFCGCPNCDAGTQDGQMTWLGLKAPGSVQCKFCQTTYPNEQFPETQTRTALNPRGQPIEYRYCRDAKGANYYVSAAAD